jgi:hypothetical protein
MWSRLSAHSIHRQLPGWVPGEVRSNMPYDDGRNSARARSARIRSSHDYDGTQLEEMRLRTAALEPRPRPVSLLTGLSAAFARRLRRRADASETDVLVSASHVE